MAHRIYAGSEHEARALADMFTGDGFAVRYASEFDETFVLLEVRDGPRP